MITERTVGIFALVATVVALQAAACGGDTTPQQLVSPTAAVPTVDRVQPTPSPEATEVSAVEPTVEPTEAPAIEPTAEPTEAASAAAAVPTFTWEVEDIDVGIKPAVAVTSDGVPYVAYMTESGMGYVRAAVRENGECLSRRSRRAISTGPWT